MRPGKDAPLRTIIRVLSVALVLASSARAQSFLRFSFVGQNAGDEFGTAINSAGDVNGDGHDDIIVGAPFAYALLGHPGGATIYSGMDGSILQVLVGTAPNQFFGLGVASAGDVDGDGILDALVGMSGNGSTGLGPGGGARILSGQTGAVIWTFAGTTANDGFGQTLLSLGDVNGDGVADVAVGTAIGTTSTIAGYARVFSGATGNIIYTKAGTFIGQRYGQAFSAGDVNGDGIADLMIGAIGNNVNGSNSGSAFVYSGTNGALLRTVHGMGANNKLGYSGCTVGDVNGDGFDDFIVGTFMTGTGYARVYSGADGSVLFHVTDGDVNDSFGHSVAGVGDANGDGTPDFAIAAPNSNVGGTLSGRVRVYSGVDASLLREFVGTPGIHLGYCLNPAGDVNGDGLADLAIGALVPGSSGQAGFAEIVSICAAQPYGSGILPTQTLSMSWILGGPGHESQGGITLTGAVPASTGILAANLGQGLTTMLDVPVLVDLDPATLTLIDVVYGLNGGLDIPIDLRSAALAGVGIYAQAFELNPGAPSGVYASNGIVLLFGP
jgi:hypothetical protein